jgi:hypothetical protein
MEVFMHITLKLSITFETKMQSTVINMNENRMQNHSVCEMKYLHFNKVNEYEAEDSFVNRYKEYINSIKKVTCTKQTKY